MTKTKILGGIQKYTMTIVLVLVLLFFAAQTNMRIMMPANLTNLISQNGYVFVLASGMLLCILTGGNIDLSVGSVACFTGAVGATMMANGIDMWICVATMLAIGLAIGAWQAYWIAYVRVPPFIVTLAGMLIFRGLSNVVLDGKAQTVDDTLFVRIFGGGADGYIPDVTKDLGISVPNIFGDPNVPTLNLLCLIVGVLSCAIFLFVVIRGRVARKRKGYDVEPTYAFVLRSSVIVAVVLALTLQMSRYKGLPMALVWVAIVIGVYAYITSKTTMGRHLYAVGGNERATKLSGINTNKVYFFAYTNMGLMSALAGMLMIARMTSAQPTYGEGYEMDAIGACFIGGASAYGGIGTIPGVILGAVLMGVINLGMSLMGVDQNYQKVVKGGVLLAAVIFDVVSKRKKASA